MATVEDVLRICAPLPRSCDVIVGDRLKFRVGRLAYASLSRDETLLGFAFPKAPLSSTAIRASSSCR